MLQGDVELLATIGWVHAESHGFANGELCAEQVNTVIRLDLVVIGWVGKGKWEHALLLQVGLVLFQYVLASV